MDVFIGVEFRSLVPLCKLGLADTLGRAHNHSSRNFSLTPLLDQEWQYNVKVTENGPVG
jgi:hypothetical protein